MAKEFLFSKGKFNFKLLWMADLFSYLKIKIKMRVNNNTDNLYIFGIWFTTLLILRFFSVITSNVNFSIKRILKWLHHNNNMWFIIICTHVDLSHKVYFSSECAQSSLGFPCIQHTTLNFHNKLNIIYI